MSGNKKFSSDHSSDKLFCSGVPVNNKRFAAGKAFNSLQKICLYRSKSMKTNILYWWCSNIRGWGWFQSNFPTQNFPPIPVPRLPAAKLLVQIKIFKYFLLCSGIYTSYSGTLCYIYRLYKHF
jgi:hypothetical protein